MPIARFKLPDGRIARFQVPEGTTPEAAQSAFQDWYSQNNPQPQQAQQGTDVSQPVSNPVQPGVQAAQPAQQAPAQPAPAARPVRAPAPAPGKTAQGHTPWAPQGTTLRAIQSFLETPEGGFASPVANQLAHGTGLAAGMLAKGVTGTAGMLGDAAAGVANMAGANVPLPSKQLANVFPQPQGAAENVADFAGTMAAGGMGDPLAQALQARYAPQAGQARTPTPKEQTLIDARNEGYVVPPSQGKGGLVGSALEGLAGKQRVAKEAAIRNQAVTNDVAAREANVGANTPLTPDTLRNAMNASYQDGYAPLENAGTMTNGRVYRQALDRILQNSGNVNASFPGAAHPDVQDVISSYRVPQYDAGHAVEAIKNLRSEAGEAYRGNNSALASAKNGIAKALEQSMELNLQHQGMDGSMMLDAFRNSRQNLAKQNVVQRALVDGTGDVNALKVGSELQKGKPLTDGLKTIGQFASAFPESARMPKAESVVGANPWGYAGWGGAGAIGALAGGAPAAMGVATLPAARYGLRSMLLSKVGQKMFVDPKLEPGMLEKYLSNPAMLRAYPALINNSVFQNQ